MPTIDALELRAMPTMHHGQDADLKIDTGSVRVWSSNMTIADGETEPVQVEELTDGKWVK
jgi:hypothetical protein